MSRAILTLVEHGVRVEKIILVTLFVTPQGEKSKLRSADLVKYTSCYYMWPDLPHKVHCSHIVETYFKIYMYLLLPTANQSGFSVAGFSDLSDVHECSGGAGYW